MIALPWVNASEANIAILAIMRVAQRLAGTTSARVGLITDMTAEKDELLHRARAAIEEAERLLEINRGWRLKATKWLDVMSVQASFAPPRKTLLILARYLQGLQR